MKVYAVTSTQVAGGKPDLFLTKEAADTELREIRGDEPEWVNVLRVVPIELDERDLSTKLSCFEKLGTFGAARGLIDRVPMRRGLFQCAGSGQCRSL